MEFSTFAELRISSNDRHSDTCGHRKTLLRERKCFHATCMAVENAKHFIMECGSL